MSENIPHSLGGFRGAFESEHGRKPTEQEIWNAAIRSWRDITRQKSDSAKELEEVIADLLMYAGDNGYSHIDYADTMRHAAALLQSAAMPVGELTDEQIDTIAGGKVDYFDRRVFARAILAAASSQPVREPLTDAEIVPHGRRLGLVNADSIALARAIEAAHGITKKGAP